MKALKRESCLLPWRQNSIIQSGKGKLNMEELGSIFAQKH